MFQISSGAVVGIHERFQRRLGNCPQRGGTVDSGKLREDVSKRKNESVTVRWLPSMGDKEISEDPVESEASEAAGKKTDYTGSESEKRVRSVCMCKQSTDHSSKTFNCS